MPPLLGVFSKEVRGEFPVDDCILKARRIIDTKLSTKRHIVDKLQKAREEASEAGGEETAGWRAFEGYLLTTCAKPQMPGEDRTKYSKQ